MLLWVLLALMTGAAVMTVLVPLSRAAAAPVRDRGDVTFYEDQLAEIVRDQERGLISAGEAAAARAEAGRRLIKATQQAPAAGSPMGEPALRRRRAAAALALSIVPLVGLAVYGAMGSPRVPGQPLAGRLAADPRSLDVDEALARIETHLAQAPGDRRGWELVAPLYLRIGRADDAARAYQTAIRLGSDGPDQLTGYGEALVTASGGVVSADAKEAFGRVLARDPASPQARFYLALSAEQDGDLPRARQGYKGIVASAPPKAPYLPLVQARLDGLSQDAGGSSPKLQGDVPPEVSAMVEGLDARLGGGGGSEAEWSRLIRSMSVLGRTADARDRLAHARTVLAGDPAALGRLDQLARDLHIEGAASP